MVVWKNWSLGIAKGRQTFPRGAALRESLMTEGIPKRKLFQTTTEDIPLFSDFWIKTVKNRRPRVAKGITLNIFH